MTVRELIDYLSKIDPDLPVVGDADGREGDVYEVEIGNRDDFASDKEKVVWVRSY